MPAAILGPKYSAEYEVADGSRHYTRWVDNPEDTVDLVGEKGGVIRALYEKSDGTIYRSFGGHTVEYTGGNSEYEEGLQRLLEHGDYDAA